MRKEARKYLKEIKLAFPIEYKNENIFLKSMEKKVYSYEEKHPHCTLEELRRDLGEPKDIVISYFYNVPAEVYLSTMKKDKYVQLALAAIIVFLIIAIAAVYMVWYHSAHLYV